MVISKSCMRPRRSYILPHCRLQSHTCPIPIIMGPSKYPSTNRGYFYTRPILAQAAQNTNRWTALFIDSFKGKSDYFLPETGHMSLEWCSVTATRARGWPQGYLNGSFSNPIFAVLSLFHHLNHWIFAFQISWGTRAWSAAAVRTIFRAKITSCSWKTATSW